MVGGTTKEKYPPPAAPNVENISELNKTNRDEGT